MASAFEQINPVAAQQIIDQLDENGGMPKQLYRIVYIARVHPNENDVTEVALVKVTLHDFASDAGAFYKKFLDNVPELYPVLFVIAIVPVSPDIPAEGMLQLILGPREIAED